MTTSSDLGNNNLLPNVKSDDPNSSGMAYMTGNSTEDRQDDSRGLIGTTEQRESLKRQQDTEYNFH